MERLFKTGDIVKFWDRGEVVFFVLVHKVHDDQYLFKGTVIKSDIPQKPAGLYQRNFYCHKFELTDMQLSITPRSNETNPSKTESEVKDANS